MRRVGLLGLVATLVVAAGCSGGGGAGEQSSPAPGPAASWGPVLTEAEAFARIPLDDPETLPLYWRLPELADPDEQEILLTARRYLTLRWWRTQLPRPDEEAHLYWHIATEEYINTRWARPPTPGPRIDPPSEGPVWIWVLAVDRFDESRAQVSYCVDSGWRGPSPDELPGPDGGSLQSFELERDQRGDGSRWLVATLNLNMPDPDLEPEFGQACDEWATHTPDQVG